MSVSENGIQEEGYEPNSTEGEDERSIQEEHAAEASINSISKALVYEDQANFNEDHGDQILRFNPPSRSPPLRPSRPTYQYFEEKEVQNEQRNRAEVQITPERSNLNKSLPSINSPEIEQHSSNKDGKKRGFMYFFRK